VLSVAVGARFSLISQHSCKRIQRLNMRVTSVGLDGWRIGCGVFVGISIE
jgi:hypothetical protein